MCIHCVREEYPDRDTMCLEDGSYYFNFRGCTACQSSGDVIDICNKTITSRRDEEVVVYEHVCKHCRHQIAQHTHSFKLVPSYQEYEMACMLCGVAEDSRSIMPCDPRKLHALVA